jgi:hypothetical protein
VRFYVPEWDDRVDADYDFLHDEHSTLGTDERDLAYIWDLFDRQTTPIDGVLLSREQAEESPAKAQRLTENGIYGASTLDMPEWLPTISDCGAWGYKSLPFPPYDNAELLEDYADYLEESEQFELESHVESMRLRQLERMEERIKNEAETDPEEETRLGRIAYEDDRFHRQRGSSTANTRAPCLIAQSRGTLNPVFPQSDAEPRHTKRTPFHLRRKSASVHRTSRTAVSADGLSASPTTIQSVLVNSTSSIKRSTDSDHAYISPRFRTGISRSRSVGVRSEVVSVCIPRSVFVRLPDCVFGAEDVETPEHPAPQARAATAIN